jgi:hypothetical protein
MMLHRKKLAAQPDGGAALTRRIAMQRMTASLFIALRGSARAVLATLSFLASPGLIMLLLLVGACGLLVAGVNVLAGFGWALIAASASLFLVALLVARGMSGG